MKRILVLLMCFFMHFCFSQNERSMVRDGNKNYNKGLFSESEIDYRKSLSKKRGFEEAQFNLSDALFKQERYDESVDILNNLISTTSNQDLKSESYYNLGNNFLQQQNLEEAVESYKNCLRINPSDEQARYNLSKAMSLMQQQDQDEQQQDQDEQQQEQNSGETDSSDNEQDDAQNENSDQNKESDDNNRELPSDKDKNFSKEEMERILDALEREEQKVQEEMQKKKQKSKQKILEKDW